MCEARCDPAALDSGRRPSTNPVMGLGPATIVVDCKKCGHRAERKRRPDDQRSFDQLCAGLRCGKCHATVRAGLVRFSLDGGKKFHRQSSPPAPPRTRSPRRLVDIDAIAERLRQLLAPSIKNPPSPQPAPVPLADKIIATGIVSAGAAIVVVGAVALFLPVIGFVGREVGRTFDRAFSETALQSSYNLADSGDRLAFCLDYVHISDGRKVRIAGETAALREQYRETCVQHAAR